MVERLKLIWLALTAPKVAIQRRVQEVQSGWNWAISNDIRKELEALNIGSWRLAGVSIEHQGAKVDVDAIHSFLCRAPSIIQRLIKRNEEDDRLVWMWREPGD